MIDSRSHRLSIPPRELRDDELIEAHALGFRFAAWRGVKRLPNSHIELAALFRLLRTSGRFGRLSIKRSTCLLFPPVPLHHRNRNARRNP